MFGFFARQAGFSFLGLSLLASLFSCATFSPNLSEISPTDAQYRLSETPAGNEQEEKPFIAKVYRSGLSPILGAECRWDPSDSAYALRKSRQCGVIRSVIKSVARYTSEFDAYQIAEGVVNFHERTHFFQLDRTCDLF